MHSSDATFIKRDPERNPSKNCTSIGINPFSVKVSPEYDFRIRLIIIIVRYIVFFVVRYIFFTKKIHQLVVIHISQ